MASRFIGIDIQPGRVDIVQIQRCPRRAIVEKAVAVAAGDTALNPDALAEALHREHVQLGAPAAVSLPDDTVLYRRLATPLPAVEQFRKVIRSELEDEVPWPYEQIAAGIESQWQRQPSGWDVLTVSTQVSAIDAVSGSLERAGLNCTLATGAASGIQAVIDERMPDLTGGDYAWLHADATRVMLGVVENGQLAMVRNLAYSVNLSSPEAANALLREIEVAWRGVFNAETPQPLTLVISCANELVDALKDEPAFSVIDLSFADGVDCGGEQRDRVSCIAYGLALRAMAGGRNGANLLAARRGEDIEKSHTRRQLIIAAVLASALFTVGATGIYAKHAKFEKLGSSLDSEIRQVFSATLPDERRVVDAKQQMKHRLDELRAEYDRLVPLFTRGNHPVVLLDAIVQSLPEGRAVRLTEVSIGEQSIRLSGLADSYSAIEQLQYRLGARPEFASVDWVSSDGRRDAVQFSLRIGIAR